MALVRRVIATILSISWYGFTIDDVTPTGAVVFQWEVEWGRRAGFRLLGRIGDRSG